jgi:hypothetical protein
MWAATDALRAQYGLRLRPAEQQRRDAWVEAVRRAARPGAFTVAWAEGKALSLMNALRAATQVVAAADHAAAVPALLPTEAAAESASHGDPPLRL